MKSLLGIFSLILLISHPQVSYGLSAPITSPEFGHRSGITEERKEKIHALLDFMREDLEFIDGMFLNQFSHQNYNGTSEKVGEFLVMVREASATPVDVEFRELDEKIAFRLNQVSTKTTITVNIARDDFRLKDFKAALLGVKNGMNAKGIKPIPGQPLGSYKPEVESKESEREPTEEEVGK